MRFLLVFRYTYNYVYFLSISRHNDLLVENLRFSPLLSTPVSVPLRLMVWKLVSCCAGYMVRPCELYENERDLPKDSTNAGEISERIALCVTHALPLSRRSALISASQLLQPSTSTTVQDHGYGPVYHAMCLFTPPPAFAAGTHSSLPQTAGSG